MGLLVVLGPSGSERRGSIGGVITEHALCCGLEISVIAAEVVVSGDLVEGVLITEVFCGTSDIYVCFPEQYVGCRKEHFHCLQCNSPDF